MKRCISLIPQRVKMNTNHTFIKTGPTLINLCVKEPIVVIPDLFIFPLDFHAVHNVEDPTIYKDRALIYTYNGSEYPWKKKLKQLKESGKCTTDENCHKLL
jgi:hypothetical protein